MSTLTLRERIAAALESAAMHPDPDVDWADAVMGVVISYLDDRRAYTDRRMEWARQSEAKIWERRMREAAEAADAELVEQIVMEEQECQDAISADPTNPHLAGKLAGLQRARDIVLARQITKEEA